MTNEPPSASVIAATTEVLELASLLDHRVPTPDKARVLAWAKQIARHPSLERDDMLDATQAFYDHPSQQPVSVGDVVSGARRIKRDRIERQQEAERERHDEKAADDMRTLAAGVLMGRVKDTPRLKAAREALQTCEGRDESRAAIVEFAAARREAAKR